MFKPGDKLNPYDPAALDLGDEGVQQRLTSGTSPMTPQLMEMLRDPAQRERFLNMMKEDAAERERTGETPEQQILREKREWAQADAKSAQFKIMGNKAFRDGDYKRAFVIYSACMHLSPHEPLYPLNRAAVALKLKMYETAVEDASMALGNGNFNRPKALFRRGQARCFLGELSKAEEDCEKALTLQPGDRVVVEQIAEVNRLRGLPADERDAWVSAQAKTTPVDLFGTGGLKRQVEEVLGQSLN
ncbi:TPR-like protein [Mycena alexandri]|uniref:TPR-like protein n=1 Tax=Mycena alexandri TaxID=1745969 RepID=A0AAD6S3G4_9AGAR|nr:TPR-like protein [Mycena alexandri]